jgi:hypothetical protein
MTAAEINLITEHLLSNLIPRTVSKGNIIPRTAAETNFISGQLLRSNLIPE